MKPVLSRITTTVSVIALLSLSLTGAGVADNGTYGYEDEESDLSADHEEGYRQDAFERGNNDDQEDDNQEEEDDQEEDNDLEEEDDQEEDNKEQEVW